MGNKLVFIGGIFPQGYTEKLENDGRIPVQIAFDTLQKNIIKGLEENLNCHIPVFNLYFLSSATLKSYRIDGYVWRDENGENYNLPYNDIKGFSHFSKYRSLKKHFEQWLIKNNPNGKTKVIVYAAYFPFLMALNELKKHFDLEVCLIVADLPEYMGLSARKSLYSKITGVLTDKIYRRNLSVVDSFVFLTEQMSLKTNIYRKPYAVMEGIASAEYEFENTDRVKNPSVIMYSGGLQLKYGIGVLLDAAKFVKNQNVEFRFYGSGEAQELIEKCAENDSRIKYCGTLPIKKLNSQQQKSTVLINPRQNTDEYTKYSFPSKNLEYMLSGRPLIAYMLDGIPKEYGNYIISPKDNSAEALAKTITKVLDMSDEEQIKIGKKARDFVLENKNYISQTKIIIDLIK